MATTRFPCVIMRVQGTQRTDTERRDSDDEHGCGEDAKVAFEDAIGRCMNGKGTDADWDWLVDMTQM